MIQLFASQYFASQTLDENNFKLFSFYKGCTMNHREKPNITWVGRKVSISEIHSILDLNQSNFT